MQIIGNTTVCLRGLSLKRIPEVLLQQTQLRRLHLKRNHLSFLPMRLAELSSLEHLDLSHNTFTAIPICVTLLPLQRLLLCHNAIECVPPELARLTSLQVRTKRGRCSSRKPDNRFPAERSPIFEA